jgi:hypothetical protein
MIALTDDQLEQIISTTDSLHSLIGVNDLSYPELLKIQDGIVAKLVENAMPMPETEAPMSLDPVIHINTAPAVIDTDKTKAEVLDDDMFTLAKKIVNKLDLLVAVAYQAHELTAVVDTLSTLRLAFYDKGPAIQVNTQHNHSGAGAEPTGQVKRFKSLLKK